MRSKRYDKVVDYRKECQYCCGDKSECCSYCESPIGRYDTFCTCCGAPTGIHAEALVQYGDPYECDHCDDDCYYERYHGKSRVLRFLSVFFPQIVMYFVGIWNGEGTKRHKVTKICVVAGIMVGLFILGAIT